jgi:hypothetical protein
MPKPYYGWKLTVTDAGTASVRELTKHPSGTDLLPTP